MKLLSNLEVLGLEQRENEGVILSVQIFSKGGDVLSTLKKTPLFSIYQHEAKCTPFAGFLLPVQFSRIRDEHAAVRERAGLFDVSHMGEIEVWGSEAFAFLQKMTTNDLSRLAINQAQYTTMCRDDGGTIDDLLIYRMDEDRYWLVVNAANTNKDFHWLKKHQQGNVMIRDRSEELALIALQGPRAEQILQRVVDIDLANLSAFTFEKAVPLFGISVMISRTGYTGEDGFELFVPSESAPQIWRGLLETGKDEGLLPCGLGARDTLRFEAAFPLYGQELSESITPIEAGLGFVVSEKKGSFIGQQVLIKQKKEGASRRLVGLEMMERGIPRSGYPVWVKDQQVGYITTGTRSPTLNKDIALALLLSKYTKLGNTVEVEIRGQARKAKIVPIPFYRRADK